MAMPIKRYNDDHCENNTHLKFKPYPTITELQCFADSHIVMKAMCKECKKNPASFSVSRPLLSWEQIFSEVTLLFAADNAGGTSLSSARMDRALRYIHYMMGNFPTLYLPMCRPCLFRFRVTTAEQASLQPSTSQQPTNE
jgi:hypothetical protein